MRIRAGGPDDVAVILAFGDEAVEWMNARGNTQQWGTEPFSGKENRRALFERRAEQGGIRVLEDEDGTPLGVMVITEECQRYVPEAEERLELLRRLGPTAEAFTFAKPADGDRRLCPA